MRGGEERQAGFIVMTTLEDVVPEDHPLRAIRALVDAALEEMSPTLDRLYASAGRPSVAPEYLLRAQLVQILYAIGSERRLCEQLRYDLLLRWFVGLPMDEPVWHPTTFTKNRDRLLTAEVAEAFFRAIRSRAEAHKLLTREHFSLDGTLIEAAAALKSLRPLAESEDEPPPGGGGRNPEVDWRGQRRGNATHRSTTDPEARLARKGNSQAAKLCYAGHSLTENRNGLIVDCELTQASGTAEREAGLRLFAVSAVASEAHERRRRPRLRREGLRGRRARPEDHPARRRQGPLQRRRPPHDPARRLRGEPAPPQAGRGALRLDEDGRRPAQAAPPRQGEGVRGLHLLLRGLQPGALAKAAGGAGSA